MSIPTDRRPRTRPLPAKVSRPSAAGLVARQRLFSEMDRGALGRLIWLTAPAGAGKTSLVSSWLAARKHKALWYRMDDGDADPASFFSDFTRGAEAVSRRRRTPLPLPLLTPEYMPNLAGYVRRYSELLWQRLGAPFVLVLDNYQSLPGDVPLQTMLATFVEHLPAGCVIVAISRETAPAPFARWQADAGFCALGWDALQLTDDEAHAIAQMHGAADRARSAQLNAYARGWSAGLVLLLRAVNDAISVPQSGSGTPGVLADYFAAEIFAHLAPHEQHFLLCTAIPTQIRVEIASALSGRADAQVLLAQQHRRRFFIDRNTSADGSVLYEYHPLFREFLLARAAQQFGAAELARLRGQTAVLLEGVDKPEPALQLYLEAQDWPNATRLICQLAPVMMQQGRAKTLEAWIVALPQPALEAVTWLCFWLGVCRSVFDPLAGRALLADAYTRFSQANDTMGALLACSEILNTFVFMMDALGPAVPWGNAYNELLGTDAAATVRSLPDEAAVRVVSAGVLLGFSDSSNPVLATLSSLGEEYGAKSLSADLRTQALLLPGMYWCWTGDFDRALRASVTASAIAVDATSPAPRIYQSAVHALMLWQSGEEAKALEAVARGDALAAQSSIVVFNSILRLHRAYATLGTGDLITADRVLNELEQHTPAARECEWHMIRSARAGFYLLSGQLERAREQQLQCIADCIRTAYPFQEATSRIQHGQALMLDGQFNQAREQFGLALKFARAMPSDILTFHALMAEAYAWLAEASDTARGMGCLREALAIGKRRGYMNCHPWWIPRVMRVLFSRALEAGIEPDYVRRFIRHRRLQPDSAEVAGWPWPVRVFTLGTFRVLHDETALDKPARAGRKPPRRVLALLQAVAALGPRGASRERLTAALWPDAEGDAARDAFDIALHRLRKLLRSDDAVRLDGGLVTLDPRQVWIDAQAFEQCADDLAREPDQPAGAEAAFARAVDKGLTLYAGHFLADQAEQPWVLPARERLRSKFERLVAHAGAHWERCGAPDDATRLYQRAVELDPLAEAAYRHLMRVHATAGRTAEALATYRRCQHMLSVVLGITPAAETEALRAALSG